MKKIAFRVDGGSQIGMGHIMRSLVLAKELAKSNEIIYVCRYNKMHKERFLPGINKIIKEGFNVITINDVNYINELMEIQADCLLTDSYDVNENYFNLTKKKFKRTIYLDDLNNYFFNVDMIINHNVSAKELIYKCNPETIKLLGPKYVILRGEFRVNAKFKISKEVSEILITMGGSDNNFVTNKILDYVSHLPYKFNAIIGPAFKNKQDILNKYSKTSNINLIENANMYKVILINDLAISACGTTIYELTACKKPIIGVVTAENQIRVSDYLSKNYFIKSMGWHSNLSQEKICGTIDELAKNFNLRSDMVKSLLNVMDINGVNNISREINLLLNK